MVGSEPSSPRVTPSAPILSARASAGRLGFPPAVWSCGVRGGVADSPVSMVMFKKSEILAVGEQQDTARELFECRREGTSQSGESSY